MNQRTSEPIWLFDCSRGNHFSGQPGASSHIGLGLPVFPVIPYWRLGSGSRSDAPESPGPSSKIRPVVLMRPRLQHSDDKDMLCIQYQCLRAGFEKGDCLEFHIWSTALKLWKRAIKFSMKFYGFISTIGKKYCTIWSGIFSTASVEPAMYMFFQLW